MNAETMAEERMIGKVIASGLRVPGMGADERALRASRDPEDWRILSDLLAERGDDEGAAYHRRMGDWGRLLFPAWLDLAYDRDPLGRTFDMGGGVHVVCERYPVTIRTVVLVGERYRRIIVRLGDVRCLYRHGQKANPAPIGTLEDPPVEIDYDRPTPSQFRYLVRRLRDICEFARASPFTNL